MAKKTREDMNFCVRVWEEWKKCQNISKETKAMTEIELNDKLSHFVLEIERRMEISTLQTLYIISVAELCAVCVYNVSLI